LNAVAVGVIGVGGAGDGVAGAGCCAGAAGFCLDSSRAVVAGGVAAAVGVGDFDDLAAFVVADVGCAAGAGLGCGAVQLVKGGAGQAAAASNHSARDVQALWFAGIPPGVAVAVLGRLRLTLFVRVPRLADW